MLRVTLRFPEHWGNPYDWRYFQTMEEVFRRTVAGYGEAPLWNPYVCGGEVALANPQATWAAPTFLLTLLWGTPLGIKLALFVYLLLALDGGYRLARELGVSYVGALVAGLGFGGSGWFALHLSSGHLNFAGAALYPYLLLCYFRALERGWRWLIPGAAALAWMAGLGGTYTTPMAVAMLGVVAVAEALERRSARPVAWAAVLGLMALLLGAVRLLPTLEFALDHPRPAIEKDAIELGEMVVAFLRWQPLTVGVPGHRYWWHEYGCHLSYVVLGLALLGALPRGPWKHRAREVLRGVAPLLAMGAWGLLRQLAPELDAQLGHYLGYRDLYFLGWMGAILWATRLGPGRRLAPLFVFALGVAAGRAWPYGPWWLLRKLPLYHELRVPSRYLILATLPLAVWAGFGLDRVILALRQLGTARPSMSRSAKGVAGAVMAAGVLAVGIEGAVFWTWAFTGVFVVPQAPPVPPASTPGQTEFYQIKGNLAWMFTSVLAGYGVLNCDEEAPLQRAESLDVGQVEQLRLLDPSAGTVTLVHWSPARVVAQVELARPTDLLVNENWNEHWKSDRGEVRAVAGRLAVRLPVGQHEVTLRYRPRSFVAGAAVSVAAWVAALALFLSRRRAV
ncbi:MAG TPA: hypothetical protein VH877_27895 [Polyangia bacterium]|nr:hypothetical protein [Polyangia bacterium]